MKRGEEVNVSEEDKQAEREENGDKRAVGGGEKKGKKKSNKLQLYVW